MDPDNILAHQDEQAMNGMKAEASLVPIPFWSGGAATIHPLLPQGPARPRQQTFLPFAAGEQTCHGRLVLPATGTALLDLVCPRSIRLWLGEMLVLDEALDWRSYQRELRAVVLFPCAQRELDFRLEVESARPLPPPSSSTPLRGTAHACSANPNDSGLMSSGCLYPRYPRLALGTQPGSELNLASARTRASSSHTGDPSLRSRRAICGTGLYGSLAIDRRADQYG